MGAAERFPAVLIRADHGQGELQTPIIEHIQAPVTHQLLESISGLFHASRMGALESILKLGVKPMDRCMSMWSTFYHLDPDGRAFGMQRWGSSDWDVVISCHPQDVIDVVPITSMRVAKGKGNIEL